MKDKYSEKYSDQYSIENSVHNTDCLNGLKSLGPQSTDMIYLDPPFFTQKVQMLAGRNGVKYSFNDKWDSLEGYLGFLKIRLTEMHRVLKETGSLFLHCDTNASHHIRVMLDEIFGKENFVSEIIWTYKRWSNSKKGLLSAHQVIFWYSKTKNYKFNPRFKDYSLTTNVDQILQERERDKDGKTIYKRDENGDIVYAKTKKGVPLSDVWHIPFLNPKAKERTGYPTQKPVALLEKIIDISTDELDLVLDPFCGSGTTLAAAKLMNRRYIGYDTSPYAVKLSEERLENPIKTRSLLMEQGIKKYNTKTEEELYILKQLDCVIVQRNKGLDAILKKTIEGRQIGVKIQKGTETITDCVNSLRRVMKKKGFAKGIVVKTKECKDKIQCDLPADIHIIKSLDYRIDRLLGQKK